MVFGGWQPFISLAMFSEKKFFLLYLLYNYGISYQLYINNIENSNRFFGRLFSTMD